MCKQWRNSKHQFCSNFAREHHLVPKLVAASSFDPTILFVKMVVVVGRGVM